MESLATVEEKSLPPSSPKKDSSESPSSPLRSQDTTCAICLGNLENKSFTDSCFHEFCFSCLLEWSKVKPECPLCKQPFKSIIHSVRSDYDYDQYYIRPEMTWEGANNALRSHLVMETSRQFFHRYAPSRPLDYLTSLPSLRRLPIEPSGFRRHIYDYNMWVEPSTSSRYRETSPVFFQENPACAHRLIPWLNRELIALLFLENEHQVSFVMDMILELILRYEIQSPEFHVHLEPYLLQNTNHFIHEFYHFARSPYEIEMYDRKARYKKNPPQVNNTVNPSSSSRRSHSRKKTVITLRRVRAESSSSSNSPSLVSSESPEPAAYEVVDPIPALDLDSGLPGSSTMNLAPPSPAESSHSSDCVIVDYVSPRSRRPIEVISLSSSSDTEIDVTTLSPSQPSTSTNSNTRPKPNLNYKSITTPLRKKRKAKKTFYFDSSDSSDSSSFKFSRMRKRRRPTIFTDSETEEEAEECILPKKKKPRAYGSSASSDDDYVPKKIASIVKKISKAEDSKCKKHKKHKKHKHSKQKSSKVGSK